MQVADTVGKTSAATSYDQDVKWVLLLIDPEEHCENPELRQDSLLVDNQEISPITE